MAAITVNPLAKGTIFPAELVTELVDKVRGKSALAKLSSERPIGFTGSTEMVFNMPNELDIVAENGAKSHGGVTIEPVTIVPIKFEYGARFSDEFMYASEEYRIDILRQFSEGFAKKAAKALDIAAMHGLNPRTGNASTVVGNNHFDHLVTSTVREVAGTSVDDTLETAILGIQTAEHDVSGFAFSPAFASKLGQVKANGVPLYPEFRFGRNPEDFAGKTLDINGTVATGSVDEAIVGNFEDYFKWGYAKEIPVEVIQYGDPDNSGSDLKGHNQVYIRAEIYLGWGILDPTAFARILPPSA